MSIFNDIIDGIFVVLKGLKDEDDIFLKIVEVVKNGVLKFIIEKNFILIVKVFENILKF